MARIIETTVYKFDELSDDAKERARDWYRNTSAGDDFFAESVIEDAQEIAKRLGVEFDTRRGSKSPAIYWCGFSSQGDGASFDGCYGYNKGAAKAVREYAPRDTELHRIADGLQDLQRRNFYRLQTSITQSGRYCHSHTMRFNISRTDDATVSDDCEESLAEYLRDFANWIYSSLESEYDWTMADEQVDESIRCNEYDFDSEGDRV